jgi:hypothetical protein
MKMHHRFLIAIVFLLLSASVSLRAQTTAATEPAVTVISFKISKDYYPMLDSKPSAISADNGELPMTEAEITARNNATARRNNRNSPSVLTDEKRSRGRLRTTIQIIDRAESVNLTIRNTSPKAMRAITWDFAFPRMEEGKLLLRYEVANQVEIKPGGKKSLKQPLPPGASRCKVVSVAVASDDKAQAAESLCGRGINDPSQLSEKQEPVIIKRIEYADGSVWQR